jgi:hypothetical protein
MWIVLFTATMVSLGAFGLLIACVGKKISMRLRAATLPAEFGRRTLLQLRRK